MKLKRVGNISFIQRKFTERINSATSGRESHLFPAREDASHMESDER